MPMKIKIERKQRSLQSPCRLLVFKVYIAISPRESLDIGFRLTNEAETAQS